jgi:hypothetical protein
MVRLEIYLQQNATPCTARNSSEQEEAETQSQKICCLQDPARRMTTHQTNLQAGLYGAMKSRDFLLPLHDSANLSTA